MYPLWCGLGGRDSFELVWFGGCLKNHARAHALVACLCARGHHAWSPYTTRLATSCTPHCQGRLVEPALWPWLGVAGHGQLLVAAAHSLPASCSHHCRHSGRAVLLATPRLLRCRCHLATEHVGLPLVAYNVVSSVMVLRRT
jgi:hypothetical protein